MGLLLNIFYSRLCDFQADNQLLNANNHWPLLFCKSEYVDDGDRDIKPALRIEMKYRPLNNYDTFDVNLLL